MLVTSNGRAGELLALRPLLQREATVALATSLFPEAKLAPLEDGSLLDTNPDDEEVFAACFPGVTILAAQEMADSALEFPREYLEASGHSHAVLHVMHSVVDLLAFAVWENGKLVRSLGMSAGDGIFEDVGERLPFELAYWQGEHPAIDPEFADEEEPYPFPFHPLEFGEAVLAEYFGYVLEGPPELARFDPEEIPLMRFRRR